MMTLWLPDRSRVWAIVTALSIAGMLMLNNRRVLPSRQLPRPGQPYLARGVWPFLTGG